MAGKLDVKTHLAQRRFAIAEALDPWADASTSATDGAKLVQEYFSRCDLGDTRSIGAESVHVASSGASSSGPNILVVGRHDVHDLYVDETSFVDDPHTFRGPGIGSRFGSTLAFAEGVQAARTAVGELVTNISFLSLGDGDNFASIMPSLFTSNIDAVITTNAISWSTTQPAVTVGARGVIVAELSLTAGESTNDFATSGAFRNPLNKLTQILGSLRDERGRITLPDFYERADAPDRAQRDTYARNVDIANQWAEGVATSRPRGELTSLERATMWPSVSILDIAGASTDTLATPERASATIALYLVPDQRHAEIERSLREWFSAQAPDDLKPALRVIRSSRPYRTPLDTPVVAAQLRAAKRLHGRSPVVARAGGPAGAGELAYTINAPVAFAGISNPQFGYGTSGETLPRHVLESGIAMAAETVLQLRRA